MFGGVSGRGKGEWRRLRWGYMIDGLHIFTWNRTKKLFAIASSGAGRVLRERKEGGDLTNVQYEPNQNCHYEYFLHNEDILIKFL
jgi:hypothetical protein